MEENEKIIELDENEKIVNLDTDVNNQESIDIYKKKLKTAKIKNKLYGFFALFFMLILIGIFTIVALFYNKYNSLFSTIFRQGANVASISQLAHEKQLDIQTFSKKLAFLDDIINMLYYYDKDNKKVQDGMFAGYLNSLGDKYAQYFPAKDFEEFTEKTTEGVYYGIGCLVNQDPVNNDCKVVTVYEGSPADKGGLKEGDIFVSIDGEVVRGKPLDEIVGKIKGEEGTKREIEVYRPSEKKNYNLTCYCGKVDIKLVNTKFYDDVAYVDIDEFTGKASSQFRDAVDEVVAKGSKAMIIDCRSNGGGELMTVLEMLDYLVRDKDGRWTLNRKDGEFEIGKTLLVYIKNKEGIVDAAYAEDNHAVDVPIVILTDYNTASAAELFTQALRDYKKAEVVGTKTFGKGVVQNIIPYEDGSAFKFTVSEYFPPSGYSIDKVGIIPDYSLDYDGFEVEYDDEKNIVVYEKGKKYILDREGRIMKEVDIPIATNSEVIATDSDIKHLHVENLKIYDDENEFLDEDWYVDLYDNNPDKQLVQALVILKDKLKNR